MLDDFDATTIASNRYLLLSLMIPIQQQLFSIDTFVYFYGVIATITCFKCYVCCIWLLQGRYFCVFTYSSGYFW